MFFIQSILIHIFQISGTLCFSHVLLHVTVVTLFPFLHLFSAFPFPPVKADWEARLSWVAANTLQKAGAWQAYSVASVGAAG